MGDKGEGITKFGAFLPAYASNSPYNFTLFSIFRGDDNRTEMEYRLEPVLEQLRALKNIFDLEIKWYLYFMNFEIMFFDKQVSLRRYEVHCCVYGPFRRICILPMLPLRVVIRPIKFKDC